MQTRSLSLLLMIVSSAIAVLPVWRSPMISSRWPRPIGIIASMALIPVCIGSSTGWRETTPGALNSAGRTSLVCTSPLPSSGLPSGSTMRPSRPSPTGISSRRPVRCTVSPSSILSHLPNSTAPTLSDSRFSARPVTPWGSSSSSSDMALSSPWTREMPSAIERTVPTSERSASPSSSPSIRLLRMLVISSGLICMCRKSPFFVLRGACHRAPESFEPVAHARVQNLVTHADDDPTDQIGVDRGGELHPLARLLLDLLADAVDRLLVELHRAGHRHLEQVLLLAPEVVERAPDPKQHRQAVLLGEDLEEAYEVLVAPLDHLRHVVLLLLG